MNNRSWKVTIAALMILAAVAAAAIVLSGAGIGGIPSQTQTNQSLGYAVHQYDGGVTHTYTIDANISPINISVGGAIYGTPTIYDGIMFVTTMGQLKLLQESRYDLTNGSVVAISMQTGKIIWRDTFPNQIMTQPIIAGGLVIVGMSNNGEVPKQYYNLAEGMIGINTITGKVIWNASTLHGSSVTGPDLVTPSYYDGLIFEPGMGSVKIYNASTGMLVNSVGTGLPDILSSPLLVGGVAYFGAGYATAYGFNSFYENLSGVRMNITSDERFFAVNVVTGRILWNTRFVNAGTGLNDVSAAYANGTIITAYLYQSDYTNPVAVALNSTTGAVLWRISEASYIQKHGSSTPSYSHTGLNYTQNAISPITIYNGTAYLNSNYIGFLFAINISRGEVLWATPTGQDEGNPNVFYGHYLITLNDAGILLVINATSGAIVNATNIGMPHLASEPVITNNYVILSGMDGRIISLPLKALIKPNAGGLS